MEQNTSPERSPDELKEISLSAEEYDRIDALDDREEADSLKRDALMEEYGFKYGDKVILKIGDEEPGVFLTDKRDFFTRDKAATLELRDYLGAVNRIMNPDVQSTPDIATEASAEQNGPSPELLEAAAEDLGDTAVENVVEAPVDEEDVEQNMLRGEQLQQHFDAAAYEFELKEQYTREEMESVALREVNTQEEAVGELKGTLNVLSTVPSIKVRLQGYIGRYHESLNDLGGRVNPDYNPHTVLARQLEAEANQLYSIRGVIEQASSHSLGDISSSISRLETKAKEALAEVEMNEDNFESQVEKIEAHAAPGESLEPPVKDSGALRKKLEDLRAPLSEIKAPRDKLEASLTEQYGLADKIASYLDDLYKSVVRQEPYDESILSEANRLLGKLGSEDTIAQLKDEKKALEASIKNATPLLKQFSVRQVSNS